MHDADAFYLVCGIPGESLPDGGGLRTVPPIRLNYFGFDAKTAGNLLPKDRKMACLAHQYPVTRRHCINKRCFPCAAAGCGVDDHRLPGFEYWPESGQDFVA